MGWSQQHGDLRKNVLLGTQKSKGPEMGKGLSVSWEMTRLIGQGEREKDVRVERLPGP